MTTQELLHTINVELSKIRTDRLTHQEIVRVLSDVQKRLQEQKED
jgi:hypothetical protein